jgi:hypothetical protein
MSIHLAALRAAQLLNTTAVQTKIKEEKCVLSDSESTGERSSTFNTERKQHNTTGYRGNFTSEILKVLHLKKLQHKILWTKDPFGLQQHCVKTALQQRSAGWAAVE